MCIFCVIQYAGEAVAQGAASVLGVRQGEYQVEDEEPSPTRDWRSYFCCFSRTGKYAKAGKMVFLHGILYLDIIEAKDIPDVDTSWFRSSKDVSDPYVTVDTCSKGKKSCRLAKTSIIFNSLNPHWEEHFRLELCHDADSLLFSVKDMDLIKVESMGFMSFRAEDLIAEEVHDGWYPITGKNGEPCGSLNIKLQFKSVKSIIRSNEVPDAVFPLRTGCHVTLYQDAHANDVSPMVDIPTSDGSTYSPPKLWIDIANSLREAKELIYIIGWSVKADISLEREGGEKETIGEILKQKADEGVRVLVLIWNEALSTDIYTPGIMGTHDEETRIYFEGTEVEVFLAPRTKSKAKFMETSFVSTLYTHHQKSIIVDVPTDTDKRGLLAYVGGLDLTDGRWDTPEHNLYKTLLTEHCHDFYNGTCSTSQQVGPRQPWHDIHTKLQGPIVLDVLSNFVERWRKQVPDREHRLESMAEEIFDIDWVGEESSSWSVQLFRSINSDSAAFRTDVLDKLLTRKGRIYDNSLQRAYIHQVRRSRHFLYIENQYFLGSSHGWLIQEAKCPHLVPVEIATKITTAIKEGELFRAYVVIPLHPEGDPGSNAVQEILHWQHRTMEMMYRKIAKALKKVKSSAHPTEYLSFFCLGKRESLDEIPEGLERPEENSAADKARQHMRFMIYVHSKMAIFDDEYAIVGSANINERSMSGNRDSEMAVGLFEEGYTKEDLETDEIRGKVHDFRLSLWAEHCGKHMEEHLDPSSARCMKAMRKLGEENLKRYISDEPEHTDCHLLLYPVHVSENGHVSARDDCTNFPDTKASVLGKNSTFLPNSLTT